MVLKVSRNAPTEELKDAAEVADQVETKAEETKAEKPESKVEETEAKADDQPEEVIQEEVEEDAPQTHDEDAQQEAPAKNTEQTSSPRTEVATRQEGAVVAAQPKGAAASYFKQLLDELESEGQEGLELGYGVFPVISLDKGEFKVGDEDLGKIEFEGVPLLSRPKYAYRTTNVPDKDTDVIFADSDREHLNPDSAVSVRLQEWKEKFEGSSWEIKKYQDVFLYMSRCTERPQLEGQVVQMSVAPTSIKNYIRECMNVKGRGHAAHNCVFKVFVGEKIRGDFDYYPWDFKALGTTKKLGVTVKIGGEIDEDF